MPSNAIVLRLACLIHFRLIRLGDPELAWGEPIEVASSSASALGCFPPDLSQWLALGYSVPLIQAFGSRWSGIIASTPPPRCTLIGYMSPRQLAGAARQRAARLSSARSPRAYSFSCFCKHALFHPPLTIICKFYIVSPHSSYCP